MHCSTSILHFLILTITRVQAADWWNTLSSGFDINNIPSISSGSINLKCQSLDILPSIINSTSSSDLSSWLTSQNINDFQTIVSQARTELAELQSDSGLVETCAQAKQVQTTCEDSTTANQNQALCKKYIENRFSQNPTDAALNALGISASSSTSTGTVSATVMITSTLTDSSGVPTATSTSTSTSVGLPSATASVTSTTNGAGFMMASGAVMGSALVMAVLIVL